MADIRINALATTAASTASDDYIAIDGSANGTRKLSAYSPTFGGNLTVSGTGTSSFAANVAPSSFQVQPTAALVIGSPSTTGSSTFIHTQGSDSTYASGLSIGGTYTAGTKLSVITLGAFGTYSGGGYASDLAFVTTLNTTASEKMRLTSGGNLLLGTTTDSSNGKLQLVTHTTSAGGIGFGPDVSLYRSGTRTLTFETSSSPTFILSGLSNGSTVTLKLGDGGNNDQGFISSFAGNLVFGRNSTTALTLDSSQRCILAGALRLNNAYTAGAPTATGYVTIQDSAGNTYKVLVGT